MKKKARKRKAMDLKAAPWQEDLVTKLPSSWHELDPDGDVVLILNCSSSIPEQAVHRDRNEGIL